MNRKIKILVVDDEEVNQMFLQYFLAKKFEVYTCGSLANYYNLIQAHQFDLVLMDVLLNEKKDGLELLKELRLMPKYRNTPVFILTSDNNSKTRTDAEDAGANQFLAKPVDGRTLVNIVDQYIQQNNGMLIGN